MAAAKVGAGCAAAQNSSEVGEDKPAAAGDGRRAGTCRLLLVTGDWMTPKSSCTLLAPTNLQDPCSLPVSLVWGNTTGRASLHLPSYQSRYGLVRWVVVGRQGLRGSTGHTNSGTRVYRLHTGLDDI